jgi:hypothetical protein
MIERVKGLRGRPYWEKDVMTKIGLPMTVKVRNMFLSMPLYIKDVLK